MKSILLTGASGMLGRATADFFSRTNYRVTATARNNSPFVSADEFIAADFTDLKFIENFAGRKFDVIVHTAALTDLERCEQENALAKRIHIEATAELARLNKETIFIYISTDSVFDGLSGNYTETDTPAPLSFYSKTKLEGEKVVVENAPNHYILRANIFGYHLPTRRSLFEWGFQQLKRGIPIYGFTDVIFNPLYVGHLAKVIGEFIENQPSFGIYNTVSDGFLSKYEFFVKCAERFNLPIDLIRESKLPTDKSLAVRPRRTFLKNDKIKKYLPDVDFSFEGGLDLLEKDLKLFEEHI